MAVVGALVLPSVVLAAPARAAAVLVVDDDSACPGAAYTTIQAAAVAATAGDTVKVCKGAYPETVTITKTLTLLGAKAGIDARTRASTNETVVTGSGGSFLVQAPNVVIDGFTVKGATNNTGIHLSAAYNGAKVTNNIIKANTFGLYANSSGPGLTSITFNRFSSNNVPGSAAGNGIYSDQGLTGGRIKNNLFENNTNAGIIIAQTSVTVNDLVVSTNQGTDNATFFAAFHGTNIQVKSNTTNDTNPSDNFSQGSAIFVGGDSNGTLVDANRVRNAPFNGIAVRNSAKNVVVQNNRVRRVAEHGISVSSSSTGATTVAGNNVMFSGRDGIELRDTTAGNTVSGNTFALNALSGPGWADCRDATLGSGTAGTANSWTSNTGAASDPLGLCTSTSSFDLTLTGAAVPTGGDADGTGTARLFLDTAANEVCYVLTWANVDGDVEAAHVHNAPAGQTGPHAVDLFDSASYAGTDTTTRCVPAAASSIAAILASPAQYYVNLHSTHFPNGALRAQLA